MDRAARYRTGNHSKDLVQRLAKVRVAGSNPVVCSKEIPGQGATAATRRTALRTSGSVDTTHLGTLDSGCRPHGRRPSHSARDAQRLPILMSSSQAGSGVFGSRVVIPTGSMLVTQTHPTTGLASGGAG